MDRENKAYCQKPEIIIERTTHGICGMQTYFATENLLIYVDLKDLKRNYTTSIKYLLDE